MLLFSLERAIELIGEAAAKISKEVQAACPEVPWADIVGMRHRLVHAHFDINRAVVWTTVAVRIPSLIEQLEALLAAGE